MQASGVNMKRLTTSILALGLAATLGTASAQSNGYYSEYGGSQYGGTSQYGTPTPDRYGQSTYGQNDGAVYDYARVIRVDRVSGSNYGRYPTSSDSGYASNSQRCYPQNQNGGYVGNDGYNRDGYSSNDRYRNDGYNDTYSNQQGSQTGRTIATVVGGIAGAVLGSKVGGGSGTYVASALGSMVGGMAGRSVYERTQAQRNNRGVVTVCDPVPANGAYYPSNNTYNTGNNTYSTGSGTTAYDVTYEYAGRRYTTRTNYNPGQRIRVRVDVRPE